MQIRYSLMILLVVYLLAVPISNTSVVWPKVGQSKSFAGDIYVELLRPAHNSTLHCAEGQLRASSPLVVHIKHKYDSAINAEQLKGIDIEVIIDVTLLSEGAPIRVTSEQLDQLGGEIKHLVHGRRLIGVSLIDRASNQYLARSLATVHVKCDGHRKSGNGVDMATYVLESAPEDAVDLTRWSSGILAQDGAYDMNSDAAAHQNVEQNQTRLSNMPDFSREAYFRSVYAQAYWSAGNASHVTLSGIGSTPSAAALANQAIKDVLVRYIASA